MSDEIIWKKLSNAWIPENKDDEISGILVRVDENVGKNQSMVYQLETENAIKGVWGSIVLNEKMKFIGIGNHVKIVFLGMKEGQKTEDYKDFDVFVGRIEID